MKRKTEEQWGKTMSCYEEVLTASDVNGDITVESHHISLNVLRAEISMKRNRYMSIYRTEPHYIKLPMWVYKWACQRLTDYVRCDPETREVLLFGFVCCPTPSICKLEEIEVF